ncbi:hypothetical protein EYF80_001076 [Liparis tanakae]|uniref:Uncharacterized protein n=1 Tax=Liparis tanakae TaxID=230148 RepID=A0A4Z2JG23_9TELE|nr:hypothetical protein EYF80_001076 [Liparis tanakae]
MQSKKLKRNTEPFSITTVPGSVGVNRGKASSLKLQFSKLHHITKRILKRCIYGPLSHWNSPLGPIVTGSSILSSWAVGMDIGMRRTTPKLVPTHRHGVGRASPLRP